MWMLSIVGKVFIMTNKYVYQAVGVTEEFETKVKHKIVDMNDECENVIDLIKEVEEYAASIDPSDNARKYAWYLVGYFFGGRTAIELVAVSRLKELAGQQ